MGLGHDGPAPSPQPLERPVAALRGFGPVGIAAIVVIVLAPGMLLRAILVLLWASWSRTPWGEIGFRRPRSWPSVVALGVPFGIAFKLVMKALVMPLLGAPPINPAYHYLAGNLVALPGIVLTMIFVAGFGEETVFRGYLFERLGRLLGRGAGARTATVVLTAGLFSVAHYPDQGLAGVEQAMITGLALGTLFTVTGNRWMPMITHAAFDLTAVALIFWNVESEFAHLVFS
jgi:CAAX protease family protein